MLFQYRLLENSAGYWIWVSLSLTIEDFLEKIFCVVDKKSLRTFFSIAIQRRQKGELFLNHD